MQALQNQWKSEIRWSIFSNPMIYIKMRNLNNLDMNQNKGKYNECKKISTIGQHMIRSEKGGAAMADDAMYFPLSNRKEGRKEIV